MTDTVALQIVNAIATRLADITTANGYNTDPAIFKGRREFTWNDSSPIRISVWAPEATPPEKNHAERIDVSLVVVVEGFGNADFDDPYVLAQQMIGDIKTAVFGPTDQYLGDLIAGMRWSGDTAVMPEPGSKVVSTQTLITVEYPELIGKPYHIIE